MSRLFDGVNDEVQWAVGNCNLTTAYSIVCLIKLDSGVSWQAFLGNEAPVTGSEIAMGRHNSGVIATYSQGGIGASTGVAIDSTDGWVLIATTRAAGTGVIPTHHKYPIGGSATHTAATGARDNQASQVGGKIVFGQIDGSDFFKGRLAVAAEWTTALSDANIESLVTNLTRAHWLSLSPVGLWDELDAFNTDHTGGGASRTSLVGTTDDADDPAGWGSWAAAGGSPGNTVAPAITGTVATGSELTCSQGTWTNSPTSYTYQWKRDNVNIGSATANTYTLVEADEGTAIKCTVTATNASGSNSHDSNTVNPPNEPTITTAPAITGDPIIGETVTCSTGSWTNSPTGYTYQWKRNGGNISGATNNTYALVSLDAGENILCTVTATNPGGSTAADSNTIIPSAEPDIFIRIAGNWIATDRRTRVGSVWE